MASEFPIAFAGPKRPSKHRSEAVFVNGFGANPVVRTLRLVLLYGYAQHPRTCAAQGTTSKKGYNMKRQLAYLFVISACASGLQAQTTNAEILGTVRDASGGVVTQAKVTVKNIETGIGRDIETNADGRFRMPQLQPGSYSISVTKSGLAA